MNENNKTKTDLSITVDRDILNSLRKYKDNGYNINLSWICEKALREYLDMLDNEDSKINQEKKDKEGVILK